MENYDLREIRDILMERGMTHTEAVGLIKEAITALGTRLAEGGPLDNCYDICEEFFNLEPDYLMALIEKI